MGKQPLLHLREIACNSFTEFPIGFCMRLTGNVKAFCVLFSKIPIQHLYHLSLSTYNSSIHHKNELYKNKLCQGCPPAFCIFSTVGTGAAWRDGRGPLWSSVF